MGRPPLPAPLLPLASDPGHSGLFLDFDGTLAAVVLDPVGARPLPGVPLLLAELATRFVLVAVVSGRPTAFLRQVLGEPAGVELVGLYGLERVLGAEAAAHWSAVIDEVVAEAVAAAPVGVYVEPKGLTVTLHWRRAPESRPWVEAFVERQHERRGLATNRGRRELELRPPVDVDKGTVLHALADGRAHPLRAVAAFGDDRGDLPAFDALGDLGAATAVRVAAVDTESPPEVAARADLTVAGATGAVVLLEQLAEAAAPAQP